MSLKLFMWSSDWRTDWSSGVLTVLAHDLQEARLLVRDSLDWVDGYEVYLREDPDKVLEVNLACVVGRERGTIAALDFDDVG